MLLRPLLNQGASEVFLVFKGVHAVTPSFVNELLSVLDELTVRTTTTGTRLITFLNPPTRLSAKFAAIARAHELGITEVDNGAWAISIGSKASWLV